MIFPYRYKWGMALWILGAILLLAGPAQAHNPNLSNWTINLSGDEPAGEIWHDLIQEIEVVGNTVHVTYWTYQQGGTSNRLYYRRSTDGGQTWQPKILLYDTEPGGSGNTAERGWKYLAVDGTSVHVAYAQYHAGTCALMYRRSTDNGASFEGARQLAPTDGGYWWIRETRIAASGGKVTIAFSYTAGDGPPINLAALNSDNGGDSFTAKQVATSGDRSLYVRLGDLKRVGDRIYLLYTKDLEVGYAGDWNSPLYCAASLDGGANFTYNRMTTAAPNGKYYSYQVQEASYSPNIAVDGDHVYVVWTQNDTSYDSNDRSLYIRRSGDGGLTFGDPQKMAQNQTEGIGDMQLGQETVASKGGYVYVVFMTQDGTVYLRRSTDSGAGFFPLQTMGTGAWWPNLVVDPSNGAKVHVFWWYTYRYSADGGASFTNPVVLMPFVDNAGGQTGVQMALGPGDAKHFTVPLIFNTPAYGWGDRDIFYRRFGPASAPSGQSKALQVYSDGDEARFDCMEVAATDWLNFSSQMSGEVWVKPFAGGQTTGFTDVKKYIFCKLLDDPIPFVSNSQYNKTYTLGTYDYGDGQRQAVAEIGTPDGWFSLSAGYWQPIGLVPDNAWTHLAFTYDAGAGENNFKLYKNGQLIASMTASGSVYAGPGNFYAGAYGRWDIKEISLWNRTLTQSEIIANMKQTLNGTEAGLNAYYTFSDTTKDMTGHGNDGILIYMETFVPAPLHPVPPGWATPPAVNSLLLD
jgi:hypothetical protein